MLGPVARISNQITRNVMKTAVRNGSHSHGGIPGENLPFDIYNRTRFTINFFLYVATGIGAPFVILRHQMIKNNSS